MQADPDEMTADAARDFIHMELEKAGVNPRITLWFLRPNPKAHDNRRLGGYISFKDGINRPAPVDGVAWVQLMVAEIVDWIYAWSLEQCAPPGSKIRVVTTTFHREKAIFIGLSMENLPG